MDTLSSTILLLPIIIIADVFSGASSGIGAGVAEEFAKYGSRLALTGRNMDHLEETAKRCISVGLPKSHIYLVTGDVTQKEDVQNIVDSTIQHYGQLNVLINNAGATRARNFNNCEVEDLDWVFNIIVRSVFMMTKAAAPHLEKTQGTIINMSSLAGLRPLPYALPYSMCKAMVDHFTRATSLTLGAKGVRINTVNPAAVKTEMFDKPDGPGGDPERARKYLQWCEDNIPLGRIGEISDVAQTVTFLASKEASFLTGVNFPIDGGFANTSYIPKPSQ